MENKMTKKIIGLTGLRGSGKDTAAKILIYDSYTNIKFSDGLKSMLRSLFRTAGVDAVDTERWIEGDLKEKECPVLRGRTPRYAMQKLGTEFGREMIADDLWTSLTKMAIDAVDGNVIVTDLRFPNEYNLLKSMGASMYRIERGLINTDLHESERYIATMPVEVIKNDGTIADLQKKMLDIVNQIA
jgi:hypothetical protein